jgi:hypothetical protein
VIVFANLAVGPDGMFANWIGAHVQRRLAGKESFKLE